MIDHDAAMRIADERLGAPSVRSMPSTSDFVTLARAYKDVVRDVLTQREAWWLEQVVPPDIEVPPADIPTFKTMREKLRRIAARAATKKPEGKDHEADRLDLRHDSGRRHV